MRTGSWIRALREDNMKIAFACCDYYLPGQTSSSDTKDAFVDGRYVSEIHQFEQGASLAQHPHADIILQNQTYQNVGGHTIHSDLCYSYQEKSDSWVCSAYYFGAHYITDEDTKEKNPLSDRFILTHTQVNASKADQNTDSVLSFGYIFDGTAAPGMPFTN